MCSVNYYNYCLLKTNEYYKFKRNIKTKQKPYKKDLNKIEYPAQNYSIYVLKMQT